MLKTLKKSGSLIEVFSTQHLLKPEPDYGRPAQTLVFPFLARVQMSP